MVGIVMLLAKKKNLRCHGRIGQDRRTCRFGMRKGRDNHGHAHKYRDVKNDACHTRK
jgi:hypothetical protein